MKILHVLALTLMCLLAAQCKPIEKTSNDRFSFLALGDSYTIGEGVSESARWPNQLRDSLNRKGFSIKKPRIIAKTGWRVDNLLDAANASLDVENTYDMVSLSIGVNNQYQNKSIEKYEKDLVKMFEKAIAHSKTGSKGVFAVNIPDYGLAPMFQFRDNKVAQEIDAFNSVFKKIASRFQIPVYDINKVSKRAKDDASQFALDGLHPSEKQYTYWVQEILPKVVLMLK